MNDGTRVDSWLAEVEAAIETEISAFEKEFPTIQVGAVSLCREDGHVVVEAFLRDVPFYPAQPSLPGLHDS